MCFGQVKKLTKTKGDIHEYLGLTINFSGKYNPNKPNKTGQVVFTMFNYIEDIVASAPPDMRVIAPDPAKSKLFDVNNTSLRLNRREADESHSMMSRLLFAAKRVRPDIQVPVAYLCTRVREPTEDDYVKLTRVIRYLRGTIYLPLVVGWDASGTLLWSIDASFAVHKDMRSHRGAMLTFGRGAVFSLSNKQKVNSTISTVVEIIGVDDAMNFVVLVKLYIEQQDVNLPMKSIIKKLGSQPSVLQQDNTSSIKLEANGKRSSTERIRHINIRHFYITDKIKSGDGVVVYHPTQKMVGDFLNKPLNSSPFKKHRNSIMGLDENAIKYHKVKYENEKVEY